MKILKKIFQSIFRTLVLSLLITSSPFENQVNNTVDPIKSHCIEEDHTVKSTVKQAKQADKKEQPKQAKQIKQSADKPKQTDAQKKCH